MIDDRTGSRFEIPAPVREELIEQGLDPDTPVEPPSDLVTDFSIPDFGNAIGKFGAAAPETSRLAAIGVYFKTATQKHRLLSLIVERGDLICDEAEEITGYPHQSASPRWNELWHDHEMIAPTGRTRTTRAGAQAETFAATDLGRAYIAEHGSFQP